jgi:hypothetical protein
MSCRFNYSDSSMQTIRRQHDEQMKLLKEIRDQRQNPSPGVEGIYRALNKIAMIGSGEKAYTADFTNEVMGLARSALTAYEKERAR